MPIQVPQAVVVTAEIMYATQSWLNVFIYYIRNKAFKETANKLSFRAIGPVHGRTRVLFTQAWL